MPRRIPASIRKKKAKLQLARAVKRGDEPAPEPPRFRPRNRVTRRYNPNHSAAEKLESAFIKLDREFLEQGKLRAAQCVLKRPVPPELAAPPAEVIEPSSDKPLSCPKRPKWHYEDTKEMVEKNEEGQFKKWLADTDERLRQWLEASHASSGEGSHWGPSYYERNLEVWRQLWRVTEISDILVVLLDSRLPLLHYPPSLQTYLATLRPASKIVLVLTKADISGPEVCALWESYLLHNFPGARVVTVESYRAKPAAQGRGRPRYEPHISPESLKQLVDALHEVHSELCEPPAEIKGNPVKMAAWKPRVKADVDWKLLLAPQNVRESKLHHVTGAEYDEGKNDQFLTIGLIGQPNVGKSSLLNALFGERKVKASKTPGKTKHFQTLFWTPDIRLCDCPGLVMPNYTHLELQVLCGILPIARIPSLPSCVQFAAEILPLERILNLTHPSAADPVPEDKRTWRPGQRERVLSTQTDVVEKWTAMDIMTAFALKNGWMTAQAGRPDVMRAGNALMRALSEGRIRWAFRPPGAQGLEDGIWVGEIHGDTTKQVPWDGYQSGEDEGDRPHDDEDGSDSGSYDESEEEGESEEEEEEEEEKPKTSQRPGVGRFGALLEVEGSEEGDSVHDTE